MVTVRSSFGRVPSVPERRVDDRRDLQRLEEVIERGLETFIEVGNALAEIKVRQL